MDEVFHDLTVERLLCHCHGIEIRGEQVAHADNFQSLAEVRGNRSARAVEKSWRHMRGYGWLPGW